jgi:hypothetical protein
MPRWRAVVRLVCGLVCGLAYGLWDTANEQLTKVKIYSLLMITLVNGLGVLRVKRNKLGS